MNKTAIASIIAGFATLGALALPAAAYADSTPVTMTVTGGALGLSVPSASVGLGSITPGQATDAASLGTLTVTDGTQKATIALFGQYVAAGFHTITDGAAGSVISYSTPPASHLVLAAKPG